MLAHILTHQWREITRAANWRNSLVINIIIGIMLVFMMLNIGVLGYFLPEMLKAIVPDQEVVLTFNKGIIYYLGLDLALRFFLQQVPVLAVQPYLHLPVRKNKLVHFVLLKSLLSFMNVLPLLLGLPFAFRAVFPAYGLFPMLGWAIGWLSLVLFNNFLIIYLKRQLGLKPVVSLGLLAGLFLLVYLESQHILPLSALTQHVFALLLSQPALVLLLMFLPLAMYGLNYVLLRRNMYISEPEKATAKVANVHEFAFLKKFGTAGNLLALEMKLIWRNKRPRSLFLMSFLMVFYGGLIILMRDAQEGNVLSSIMVIFWGIMITGAFMMYYGQFLHSWDANYFDTLMTRNINAFDYYRSKFLLFVGMCTLSFILSLFYAFWDWHFLPLNLALYLFNIGVNSFVIFLLGVYDPKKINLSKNSAFNWEGTGAGQFITSLPLMIAPLLIYLPFYMFGQTDLGLVVLGSLGIIGLIFHKPILKKMASRLNARKYKMSAAFRAA